MNAWMLVTGLEIASKVNNTAVISSNDEASKMRVNCIDFFKLICLFNPFNPSGTAPAVFTYKGFIFRQRAIGITWLKSRAFYFQAVVEVS